MGIRTRRHIIVIFFCFLAAGANSQNPSPKGVNNYRETVWLSSDRHLYLSGEDIRFDAKVLEQDSYLRSQLSHNLRIELLDSKGLPVSLQNLILKDAGVTGSFILPTEAQTGWYYIRAYTNWMRNNPSSEFGLLAVKVVNPQSMDLGKMQQKAEKIRINLYPNGRETGLFAGPDESHGVQLKGWLINSIGDSLISFTTHPSGWTYLEKKLADNEQYRIKLEGFSGDQYYDQAIIKKNAATTLDLNKKGEFIEVEISGETPPGLDPIKLIIHQSYTLYWESEEIQQGQALIRIPANILPVGIVQFSLLGKNDQLIAKRLWSEFNTDTIDINLSSMVEDSLELRNPYTLNFSDLSDSNDLCIFIGLDEPNHPLKNFIPGLPGWNCTSRIPNDLNAFNGWLLGNSYPDDVVYSIQEANRDEAPKAIIYLPETRSGVISGKVINQQTGVGIEDIGICITVLNNNYFEGTTTNEDGIFHFALPGQNGATDYILNFTSQSDSTAQIVVSPMFASPLAETLPSFSLSENELVYLQGHSINLQLQRIYRVLPDFPAPIIDSILVRKTFFHPPDYTIVLEDFIKLANIKEVIYEVVPNVAVRKRNGHEYLKVFSTNPFPDDYETLVLLDGIPLGSQKDLLELSPDRIEKIEVKNKLYIHGRNIYSAIVNFVSPNRDYAGLDLPENSILSTLNLPSRMSQSDPPGEMDSSTLPLLENTLYWRSDNYSKRGKVDFYTNDLTDPFQILIYGFDKQGKWVFGSQEIPVGK